MFWWCLTMTSNGTKRKPTITMGPERNEVEAEESEGRRGDDRASET